MTDVFPTFPLSTVQPGAYSYVDASALQDADAVAGSPVVAVIGDCTGGQPATALKFTSQQALKETLRSGPALDVARAAMIGRARTVIVVRVGNAITQATSALAGATGTPVTLRSKTWGVVANSIKRTITANNTVAITYVDAAGTTFTETFACGAGATIQDVVDTINGKKPNIAGSAFVTAEAPGGGTLPLTPVAIANLTGGADTGTIVTGDWTVALAALETQAVSIIVPATGDATVHAQVAAHCDAMSVPSARAERTTVVGAVAGESVAAQVTRAASLRKTRVQLVYPGITLFDTAGVQTAYAPFVAAGYTAGRHVSLNDPAEALTHAPFEDVLDVEKRLSKIVGGDVDVLLTANVSPITPNPSGGFWLEDSLSGYQLDNSYRDFHKTRSADEVSRRLRVRLEGKFVGGKGLNGTADAVRVEAIAELEDEKTEQLIRDYLLSEVRVVEAGSNPSRLLVTCPVMLVDTTKFILITVALQPPSAARTA